MIASVGYRLAPEHPLPGGARRLPGRDALAGASSRRARADRAASGGRRRQRRRQPRDGVARRLRDQGGPGLRFQALDLPGHATPALDTPSYRDFNEGFGLTLEGMRRYWNLYLDGATARTRRLAAAGDRPRRAAAGLRARRRRSTSCATRARRYAARCATAGVDGRPYRRYDGTIHGFWRWMAATDATREAIDTVGAALRRDLG